MNMYAGIARYNELGLGNSVQADSDISLDMSDNEVLYAASLFSVTSLVALVWRWQRNGGRPPYSPGPRGYPLIGSVLDVPQKLLIWGGYSVIAQRYSKCSAPVRGYPTEKASILRHRCTEHEVILKGFRHSDQLRGHLRPFRKTVRHLLRQGQSSRRCIRREISPRCQCLSRASSEITIPILPLIEYVKHGSLLLVRHHPETPAVGKAKKDVFQ